MTRKADLMLDWPKGSPPPTNYAAWRDWSVAQHAHGLKQTQCKFCRLFRFPQEMDADGECWTHAGKVAQTSEKSHG